MLARQLTSELREVCSRLRPAILDDLGLVPALDWLLEGVARQSGLSTRLELNGVDEDERFSPEVELALFRVTQEATNNAMKHSRIILVRSIPVTSGIRTSKIAIVGSVCSIKARASLAEAASPNTSMSLSCSRRLRTPSRNI